jgi:hypothetical protein
MAVNKITRLTHLLQKETGIRELDDRMIIQFICQFFFGVLISEQIKKREKKKRHSKKGKGGKEILFLCGQKKNLLYLLSS